MKAFKYVMPYQICIKVLAKSSKLRLFKIFFSLSDNARDPLSPAEDPQRSASNSIMSPVETDDGFFGSQDGIDTGIQEYLASKEIHNTSYYYWDETLKLFDKDSIL